MKLEIHHIYLRKKVICEFSTLVLKPFCSPYHFAYVNVSLLVDSKNKVLVGLFNESVNHLIYTIY